jgi:hypothetical protein
MILQWLLDTSGSIVTPVAFGVVTTVISLLCSRALLGRRAAETETADGSATVPAAR